MQTVDIAAIRAQIKSNISAVLSSFEVYDYEPKNKTYPSATVSWPSELDPRVTQAGGVDMTIPVTFEVMWIGDESSDQTLMDAMEAAVNAIETDRTLNSEVCDLSCGPFIGIGPRVLPDERVLMMFTVPVEILI